MAATAFSLLPSPLTSSSFLSGISFRPRKVKFLSLRLPPMSSGAGMDAGFRTGRRATVTKGEDVRYDLTLEFSEAIFGTYKEFELSHLRTCEVCAGTGAKVGSKMRMCSTCGGRGQVKRTEQFPFGLFSQVSVCPTCGGKGEVISENCRNCSGEGRVRVKKQIKVKVPPGVSKGTILRIAGAGDAGPKGGSSGDLYVHLHVSEIPEIHRDGIKLQSTISISYIDAILGAVVQVKTVEGNTNLEIPPGTQHGDVLVLTKKGAPKLCRPSIRGDHLFTVEVTIPKRISGKDGVKNLLSVLTQKTMFTRPQARPAVEAVDNLSNGDTDESQESGDEDNFLKKLKDVAGSVANGTQKWLRDKPVKCIQFHPLAFRA